MSIVVEALTLVVSKSELDTRFPGGSAGFLGATLGLRPRPRYACGDDPELVSVSFYDAAHMAPYVALLRQHGFADGHASSGMVCVDQVTGPLSPCTWLEWARHEAGFTHAWPRGAFSDDLAVDEEWTPERSQALLPCRPELEPERFLTLTTQDGLAVWLDTVTGKQVLGMAPQVSLEGEERPVVPGLPAYVGDAELEPGADAQQQDEQGGDPPPEVEERIPLRKRIARCLKAEGVEFDRYDRHCVVVTTPGRHWELTVLVRSDRQGNVVLLHALGDLHVPQEYRSVVSELLLRVNWDLDVGTFAIDPADGEVEVRVPVVIADSELRGRQLVSAMVHAKEIFDRYYPAIMRVIYGRVTAEEAIREVDA